MSKLAWHVQHYKKESVSALGNHNYKKRGERDRHSNQDIDPERSKNNIVLVKPEEETLYTAVKKDIATRVTGRVTKASVWISEHIVYPPEGLSSDQIENYFRDVLEFFKDKFGSENIKLFVIHMDETTAHAHIDTVPITKEGKLSRKEIYTRAFINSFHTDLSKHLSERGWDIQRGDSTKDKHVRALTVPEYKKQAEEEKLKLMNQIQENKQIILNQEEQIAAAEERLTDINDWLEYDQVATDAWNTLEQFRSMMMNTFNNSWIFRNKKGEQALLKMVEGCRDYLMSSLSALRGFELREKVEENRQRSKALTRALDELIKDSELEKKPGKIIDQVREDPGR